MTTMTRQSDTDTLDAALLTVLEDVSPETLLTAIKQLTHKIDAATQRAKYGPNERLRNAARDNAERRRAERALVEAEVLRRIAGV